MRSWALAAPARASTASSGVLKDCWALAADVITNASSAAVSSLASDEMGLVKERFVIMASSLVQARQCRIGVVVGIRAPDAFHRS